MEVDCPVVAVVDGILNNIDGHLLHSVRVSNYVFWKEMVIILELRNGKHQRMFDLEGVFGAGFEDLLEKVLERDDVNDVKSLLEVGVEVELQSLFLGLAQHEGVDVIYHFLEVEADVFSPEMAQLDGLPVLHVVKLKDD